MSLPIWAKLLQTYNPTHHQEEAPDFKTQSVASSSQKTDSYQAIPAFFHQKGTTKPNELLLAVNEIARELFLDNHEEMLLSEYDLDCLFNHMMELSAQGNSSNDDHKNNNCFIDYEIFNELKQNLPKRAHKFFTASIFRKFPLNQEGKIRGTSFHSFVSLSLNLLHQFITLSRYDIMSNKSGYLTESDLEIFIGDQIEMIPSLQKVDEAFHPYYIYHAVRKFMFCLNPDNSKKHISITKVLCSDAFREFNEFRFCGNNQEDAELNMINATKQNGNWFSCQNALRVYKMYLSLDCDHNGTLSQKEMLQFNQSSLSNLTVQRIFQYKKTWDQEMDYKGFLNFVLAMEHTRNVSSLHYFWEILDLDGNGYLTPLTIHTLFRSVQKKMGIFGLDPINADDVLTEIIDMVHPKDDERITKQDLIDSKMFGTVIDVLTDVKGFWEYDNRESMIVQEQ